MIEEEADFYERLANYVAARSAQIMAGDWPVTGAKFPAELGPAYMAILIATGEFLVKEREMTMNEPNFDPDWLNYALYLSLEQAVDIVECGDQWNPKGF